MERNVPINQTSQEELRLALPHQLPQKQHQRSSHISSTVYLKRLVRSLLFHWQSGRKTVLKRMKRRGKTPNFALFSFKFRENRRFFKENRANWGEKTRSERSRHHFFEEKRLKKRRHRAKLNEKRSSNARKVWISEKKVWINGLAAVILEKKGVKPDSIGQNWKNTRQHNGDGAYLGSLSGGRAYSATSIRLRLC